MKEHEKRLKTTLKQTNEYMSFRSETDRLEEWLVAQLRILAAAEQSDEQRLRVGAGSLDGILLAFPVRAQFGF